MSFTQEKDKEKNKNKDKDKDKEKKEKANTNYLLIHPSLVEISTEDLEQFFWPNDVNETKYKCKHLYDEYKQYEAPYEETKQKMENKT
jgi:hypothetical protein